ncbi:WXG100 family type VII secretion target [Mycobacterium sp. M1]|uniref:WXG100 family type VII secretion target n=1 Tax=Mycolicibacter acidiphilus TaxID=2835306 RepID=A0ABS5RN08_9MYCO|nr:type VII secretion target [Mycolicibacter acidiphilus]MBS9535695.1 WXG100 family type VII secretion target [Mycolicibacter acidiphilus]
MPKSLKVDPAALHQAAGLIDDHAGVFATAHQEAHAQAARCSLGSGAAAGALTQMLQSWEAHGARFSDRHTTLAADHRQAANTYLRVDGSEADAIDSTGSTL